MPQKLNWVKTGLDVLVEEKFARLKPARVAILAHPASVDRNLSHIVDLCRTHGVKLVRLFGPEHGYLGNAQDMEAVLEQVDPRTGLPVTSLYGQSPSSLSPTQAHLQDVDILLCDLQDIGSRYYTFAYTVAFAMRACTTAKIKCVVLDRPNPLGGVLVQGNDVLPDFMSFVGAYPLANRHGLTMGELAQLFNQQDGGKCDLEVIHMKNWRRDMLFYDSQLPWVFPSPNMPSQDTALVYPGACLFEGTNLSEGRGTTRPFELVGAPYIKDPFRLAEEATSCDLPGVHLRPCYFQPTSHKFANEICGGVQIHITDANTFEPLKTAIAILRAARTTPGFMWRTQPYEFVSDRLAIDLLFGDDQPRKILDKGGTVNDVQALFKEGSQRFLQLRQSFLHAKY